MGTPFATPGRCGHWFPFNRRLWRPQCEPHYNPGESVHYDERMPSSNPYADALAVLDVPPLTPARASIERALVEWMQEHARAACDLTVCGLAQRAFVARSTVYANYRSVDDVLAVVESRLLAALMAAGKPLADRSRGVDSATDAYDAFVALLHAREREFRLLLEQVPSARFAAQWKRVLGWLFWERLFAGSAAPPAHDRPSTVNRALVLEMLAEAFIAAVRFWLAHPDQVGTAELKALIARLIHDIDEVW